MVMKMIKHTSTCGVVSELAFAQGRRDEAPNVALAERLAQRPDATAVSELVAVLTTGSVAMKGDAIKVLYELGRRKPELIAPHTERFIALLSTRNNRLHWGLLSALDALGTLEHQRLFENLPPITAAAFRATVIGQDKAVSLLCKLYTQHRSKKIWTALMRLLDEASNNQFPSYAEHLERVAKGTQRTEIAAALTARLPLVPQPAKIARLTKTLRRLQEQR